MKGTTPENDAKYREADRNIDILSSSIATKRSEIKSTEVPPAAIIQPLPKNEI